MRGWDIMNFNRLKGTKGEYKKYKRCSLVRVNKRQAGCMNGKAADRSKEKNGRRGQ